MAQTKWFFKMTIFVFISTVVLLMITGCNCPKELKALQDENVMLTDRIIELENELAMADAAAVAPATAIMSAQPPAVESVYIIAKGDTLWNIAQRQLGKGSRYKEILALNPQLSENAPLKIGTTINLPAK